MKKIIPILLLLLSLKPAMADVDLAATTDTNGFLTWPNFIPAIQVGPYTNGAVLSGGTGATSWQIGTNGYFSFTDANGMVIQSGYRSMSVTETNGNGFVYSNGVLTVVGKTTVSNLVTSVATITNVTVVGSAAVQGNLSGPTWSVQPTGYFGFTNGAASFTFNSLGFVWYDGNGNSVAFTNSQFYYDGQNMATIVITNITMSAVTNVPAISNLYSALNSLSNQMFLSFSASNTTYQTQMGTLGINTTNYAYFLITNNGALFTNFANYIGANATNEFLSTNFIAAHFRFGSAAYGGSTTNESFTFSPGFNDANYFIYVSDATVWNPAFPTVPQWSLANGYVTAYNTFVITTTQPLVNASTINYMLFHP